MTKILTTIKLAETLSGHYYHVGKNILPSVTTILNAFPQPLQLQKWVAEQGWDNAQDIKNAAGDSGTKCHLAIEDLFHGANLSRILFSKYEWTKLMAFVEWHKQANIEAARLEQKVYSKKYKYAGSVDALLRIDKDLYLCDWKTSSAIHENFYLQVAAYAHAHEEMTKEVVDHVAILQLGAKNKNGYRFVTRTREEWQKDFQVFLGVKKVWDFINGDKEPPVLELPETLTLDI